MSENKDYVTHAEELGCIHISEEVLAAIAAAATLEVKGVGGLAANLGSDIAELLGKKNLAKGVHVKMDQDVVDVEVSILMAYGHTIPEVGKAVQDGVKIQANCQRSQPPWIPSTIRPRPSPYRRDDGTAEQRLP